MEANANRLLYDKEYLGDVRDRLEEDGVTPKATEIKRNVDTSATIYEIRTAITYWFGGRMSHRESDRIWTNCQAFDNDEWRLDANDEIIYA